MVTRPVAPKRPAKVAVAKNGFMQRVCELLGVSPFGLGELLDVDAAEMQRMDNAISLGYITATPAWYLLTQHVNDQIGRALALREELQRKLSRDMQAQMLERLRIEQR